MKGILVFGDSIVWGRGEQPSIGWVGRLKDTFESEDPHNALYNLGIVGETSTELLARIENEAKARIRLIRPTDAYRIVIAIGTNDARCRDSKDTPQTGLDTFRANVDALLSIAKRFTGDVMVVGLTPVDEELTNPYETSYFTLARQHAYVAVLREQASLAGVVFVDLIDVFNGLDLSEMLVDGLHPSAKGYEVIAQRLRGAVLKPITPT